MTLGGQDMDRVLPVLNQYVLPRHEVAKRVHLRRLPAFKFVRDDSMIMPIGWRLFPA